jgi:hypothetical protein
MERKRCRRREKKEEEGTHLGTVHDEEGSWM